MTVSAVSVNGTVVAERLIPAEPAAIFRFLTNPSNHPRLDGSGMVRRNRQGAVLRQVGDSFTMGMRLGIPYRTTSTVVEYEQDRRIAWRPYVYVFGRRLLGGQRWRYELEPSENGQTLVRESYVLNDSRTPFLYRMLGYPKKMASAMERTLQHLTELVEESSARSD